MATENILIKFTSDTSGLKDSVAELQKIGKLSDEDAKKFQMMEGFAEGVADALKEAGIDAKTLNKEIGNTVNSGKSLKAQFSDAKNEAVKLSREFGATSVQARNAAKSAALLKDEIDDMNGVLKALNPEAKLNAFVNLGQGVQGAFQAATGALQVFGVENERITKLAQQFQGVLNLTQGINSVLQLKDVYTQLRLVLGVTTVAQNGLNASMATTALAAAPLVAVLAVLAVAFIVVENEIEKSRLELEDFQKRMNDLDEASELFGKRFNELLDERLNKLDFEIKKAEARGASEKEILQLTIKRQQVEDAALKRAIEGGKATIDQEKEFVKQLQKNGDELELNLIRLDKILQKEKEKKDVLADQALRAAQAQRDIEAAATKSLKAQFDSEYQARLEAVDQQLELSKIVNEIISKDASDRIKRDLVSEIDALEKKLKETEETQKQDLANFEYYENEKEKIRAKIAVTKKNLVVQEVKDDEDAKKERLDGLTTFFNDIEGAYGQLNNSLLALNTQLYENDLNNLKESKENGFLTEKQYNDRVKSLREKQFEINKKAQIAQAIIGIAQGVINALAVTPPQAVPAYVALAASIGAINLARILSTEAPKFKSGTLNVGGGNLDADGGMHAIIHKGEAIIPADRNREYHPTIKALYNRQVKASDINSFVQMKMNGKLPTSISAKLDTNKLGKMMRGSGVVELSNAKVVGKIIASELNKGVDIRRW